MPHTKKRSAGVSAIGCLAALTLLAGCGGEAISAGDAKSVYAPHASQFVSDLQSEAKSGAFKAGEKELEALSAMEEVLSNDHLTLYLGRYYDIAVLDKDTGSVFFSNRAVYEDDTDLSEEGKADAYSQVAVEYYDGASARNMMSSYPNSVDDDGLNQVTVKAEPDSLTITYAFGTNTEKQTICYVMSQKGYDQLAEKADRAIGEERISTSQFARFQNLYQAIVYDELDDADKAAYAKKYSGLASLGLLYVCDPTYLTSVQRSLLEEVSAALSIDESFISREEAQAGAVNAAGAAQAYFEIPVVYRLQERDLIAQIDTPHIVHVKNSGYTLTKIYLLSNLFSTTAQEEGYLMIPDGSGAVIENSSRNGSSASLTQTELPFYGSDFGVNHNDASTLAPYSPFPVFGIRSGNRGVFGIVESGDAMGGVRIKTVNSLSSYNTAAPYFTYYTMDVASNDILDQQENVVANRVYSKKEPEAPYVVRYHFLYGENAGYSGMARYYRTYLAQTGSIKKLPEKRDLRLDVSFLGAVTKRKMVGFIPMNVETAASTFEGIQAFGRQLAERNVASFNALLLGAINGGMQFRVPHTATIEKSLGGTEGLSSLTKFFDGTQGRAYLGVDFTRVYRNGNGLNTSTQISRFISNDTAVLSGYSPSSGRRDPDDSAYLLNPLSYGAIIDRFHEDGARIGANTLFVSSLCSYLSGNYDERHEVTREESKNITVASLEKLVNNGYTLLADGGNAYTLKYLRAVTDISLGSSEMSMESYAIPFVGMVLHGYMEYSGVALNQQGSYQKALLKNIESGAGLHYVLMTEDPLLLADTSCSDYYSVAVDTWEEEIISTYTRLNALFREISDSVITEHKRLTGGVVQVSYENGGRVLINYNNDDAVIEGYTIAGMDFLYVNESITEGMGYDAHT